jgi:hypothetical protein
MIFFIVARTRMFRYEQIYTKIHVKASTEFCFQGEHCFLSARNTFFCERVWSHISLREIYL